MTFVDSCWLSMALLCVVEVVVVCWLLLLLLLVGVSLCC